MKTNSIVIAVAALMAIIAVGSARADIELDFSAPVGATVHVKGSGSSATINFNTINVGGLPTDIQITNVIGGVGTSAGFYGVLSGTYSYSAVTTVGPTQTAVLSTVGGHLLIRDSSNVGLNATVAGVDISTTGTGTTMNVSGTINLSAVSYAGTDADLIQLKNEAAINGGVLVVTFQWRTSTSLTDMEKRTFDKTNSFSGLVATSVPEPSALAIAGLGALGMVGCGLRRRRGA